MASFVSRRMAGIILAAATALALAACSAVKLGYNTLPKLAYWWLDGYVDLREAQGTRVKQDLVALMAWHREKELPRVLDTLARMERLAPGDITPQQACSVFDELRTRLVAVGEHVEPEATALAMSLDADQLRRLERKFHRNDEKFFHDWLEPSVAEQREKILKQMTERFELIYGRLQEPQRAVMRERIAQVPYEASRILAERQRRQKDLLQVLHRITQPGVSVADARAQLHAWLERVQHSPDASFRFWQEGFIQEGCRTFALVHRSTTPAQRQNAVERLRGYERDVRELMAQSQ
jgi:hypothetical protein